MCFDDLFGGGDKPKDEGPSEEEIRKRERKKERTVQESQERAMTRDKLFGVSRTRNPNLKT
jgi:hypothetical protein